MSLWTIADCRIPPKYWVDPSRPETFTLDANSRIVEVANLGTAAVQFAQPDPTPRPLYDPTGLNGLPAVTTMPDGAWLNIESDDPLERAQAEFEELFLAADTAPHAGFDYGVFMQREEVSGIDVSRTPAFYLQGGSNGDSRGSPTVYGARRQISVAQNCVRPIVQRFAVHRQKHWLGPSDGLGAICDVDGIQGGPREAPPQSGYPYALAYWFRLYGAGTYSGDEAQNVRARMGEWALFPGGLMPWEAAAIEGALAHKYGKTSTLGPSHHFRAAPPTKSGGNAREAASLSAVDLVAVRDYDTKESLGFTVPLANGDWTHPIPAGKRYDLTYYAKGCAPVVHGPYQAPDP